MILVKDDDFKSNQNRADFLEKVIKDDTWYKRVESYTSTNFDVKHEKRKQKIESKMARKKDTKFSRAMGKVSAYFGDNGLTDYFFFFFNVVLAIYNFWSIQSGMALWFGSMGFYYAMLAFLRFLILKPKPWPFQNAKFSRYFVRKCQCIVFYLLGGLLPFILFFTMTVFSHSQNDSRIVLVFFIYSIFKISAFVSKFVTYHMQFVSPFSPLNSINHVELMMAILTILRYWMGMAGDDSYGFVFLLTGAAGIFFIIAIIFLGVYAGQRAKDHKMKMDAGIDEEAAYKALEKKALEVKTANVWEILGVDTSKNQTSQKPTSSASPAAEPQLIEEEEVVDPNPELINT